MFKYALALMAIFVFAPLHLLSATDPDLDKTIEQLLEEHHSVGLSIVVVKDGDIIYLNSFGKKNLEQDLPLQSDDLFRIASISKSFSAIAILQLVEKGEISLDDDISDLIGFKVRNPHHPDEVITLRMMLSHTSSISDSGGYFTLDTINPNVNSDWQKSFNDYTPGAEYEYSNLNFNMIGAVIENITGTRFDQHINEEILGPLGLYGGFNVNLLDSTRLTPLYSFDSDSEEFTVSTSAYAPRKEEINNYKMGYSTPIFSPTGGMKLSAEDLAKYMTMHMNYGIYNGYRLLSEESAKLMQTPIAIENGYGLALRTLEQLLPGKKLIGHTGSAYGLYSLMAFHPEEKFGFVAITNGGHPIRTDGVNHLLLDAVKVLYSEYIE